MSETQNDTHHDHQAVTCDGGASGGNSALGHPKVYLDLQNGTAKCPYCSKEFTSKDAE